MRRFSSFNGWLKTEPREPKQAQQFKRYNCQQLAQKEPQGSPRTSEKRKVEHLPSFDGKTDSSVLKTFFRKTQRYVNSLPDRIP